MATEEQSAVLDNTRRDLRDTYLLAFDQFAIVPADIPIALPEQVTNTRYARELLGILTNQGLLVVQDVNGDGDVWQTDPTYDTASREEAEAKIDAWLDAAMPTTPTPATPKKKETKMTATATKPAPTNTDFRKCPCGCGDNVAGKSMYKPGHDARHAGQVARLIVETPSKVEALVAVLPTIALQTKARDLATLWIAKAEAKAKKQAEREAKSKKTEWTDIEPVKHGRWTYPARKSPTGVIQRNTKKDGSGEWVTLED